uniref:GATA-type domain-containing protein n=1 Tax=Meloidogyne incognita TaxID=6306 RepID=A0A914MTN8_MELIC
MLILNIVGDEINKRNRYCFSCGIEKTLRWNIYLKEHYLCGNCYNYKQINWRFRPIKKGNRHCHECGVTQTTQWRIHPELKHDLCNACGMKQRKFARKEKLSGSFKGKC